MVLFQFLLSFFFFCPTLLTGNHLIPEGGNGKSLQSLKTISQKLVDPLVTSLYINYILLTVNYNLGLSP